MAVDRADDVPAVGHETQGGVVDEPGRDLSVNGNAVVVVQRHQLVELPGAGQRRGFVADAFHQAAVAQEHIGAVVDHGMVCPIELAGQQLLGQRHAHGIGKSLAQRTRRGFHARRDAVLGMAGGLAVQLAEILQLLHRQVITGEIEQRVQQHRRMSVGQHETIAVKPVWIARVVFQMAGRQIALAFWAPQGHCHVCHAHRCPGMAGVGLLHGIHCQCANGVGHCLRCSHGGAIRKGARHRKGADPGFYRRPGTGTVARRLRGPRGGTGMRRRMAPGPGHAGMPCKVVCVVYWR